MSRLEELIAELCPDGVEYKTLGEVAHYSKERFDASLVDSHTYVGVDNLLPDKKGKTESTYVPNEGRLIHFVKGDILIGNIRPYLKKIWLAEYDGGTNGDVLVIRKSNSEELLSEYLYYILSSDRFFDYDVQYSKGAKMPRGNKELILKYLIPLPPLEVQSEIVRILDEYTEKNAELIDKLAAELDARKKQYEYYIDSLLTSDKNIIYTLKDVATFSYGFTDTAKDVGTARFIRITDIDDSGNLHPSDKKYVDICVDNERYFVKYGDILMARTGATYGKTLYVSTDEPAIYASFLIKINLDNTKVLNRYYWYFSKSSYYWKQAEILSSKGGQPQFNSNTLSRVKIPLPPLAEQERIVSILDRFDKLCNDISEGLPAEMEARRKQYEHYRDRLLTFKELEH